MTIIAFQPTNASTPPFQAQVTLDGNPYLLAAMWNLYRGGWYVAVTGQNGTLACNMALVGSPPDFDIDLFPGIFETSKIVYRVNTGNFEITP